MHDPQIPYRIERTKNKHSRAVYRNEEIVIRLAKRLSAKQERNHVNELLKRMTQKVIAAKKKMIIDPFRPLLDGASTLRVQIQDGTVYHFELSPGKRHTWKASGNRITVTVSPSANQTTLHRTLWKALSDVQNDQITKLVQNLNTRTLEANISQVKLQVATSQWGSCSSKGAIMINAALLFVPKHLLEYVIIHELCHRKRRDHSPAYWKIVEKHCPTYKADRKEVRNYLLPSF